MISYPFANLGPGQTVTAPVKSNYVKYVAGSAGGSATALRIRADVGGADVLLEPGEYFRVPETVSQWYVTNVGPGTITGRLVLGLGELGGDRIAGVVEVIDGGRSRSLSGAAFLEPVGMGPPGAGLGNQISMWNAPGNGRATFIKQIYLSSASAQSLLVGTFSVAPGSLSALGGNKAPGSGFVFQVQRGIATGAAFAMQNLAVVSVAASQTVVLRLDDPIVLRPGRGVGVVNGAQNTDLNVTFEGYEELLT
jgi:hypothetical protein